MKIALTFDIERDNPNFLDTYQGIKIGLMEILKILSNFNIKGTFFCTGNIAKHHPNYIELIEHKGHEIACHSLNHERLTRLNFKKCEEIINQNKKILENTCQNSEIIGFRAPYLKPPKFLFKILSDLGFKYDSSITSPKKLKDYQIENCQIQEFHPSNLSILFRLPLSYSYLLKRVFKNKLTVLYFHPWEAINMKDLIFKQSNMFTVFKNIGFRPDRWGNTGDSFINKFSKFLKDSILKNAEFIPLKQLIIERDKSNMLRKH